MNKDINNKDGYVEVRNDSHASLFVRIVKTECGNTHIYIEDAPEILPTYDPDVLDRKDVLENDWEFVDRHDGTLVQVRMVRF